MPLFRLKSPLITAHQLLLDADLHYIGAEIDRKIEIINLPNNEKAIYIRDKYSLSVDKFASPGDYVVINHDLTFTVVPFKEFKQKYEPAFSHSS